MLYSTYTILPILSIVALTLLILVIRCRNKNKALTEEAKKLDFRLKLSEESRDGLEKYRLAVENVSDLFIITDSDANIIEVNKSIIDITGYTRDEIIGKTPAVWGNKMPRDFYETMWQTIKEEKKVFVGEVNNVKKSGEKYTAEIRISPILNKDKEVAFFVGVERDITKAKEVDRMKSEFISLASHQLRTPLSGMKWYLEMLLNEDMGPLSTEQRGAIQNIEDSNERMIELVNSLLNISRIESGRLIIDPEPTDLVKLAKGVIAELKQKLTERKHKYTINIEDNLPIINIDPNLIRHVFMNLLTNAIKYTAEGGEINMNIFRAQDTDAITIQVCDTGYGIRKEEHSKVFQKFFRGQNIIEVETDGSGLGLYLAKAIVEASGGTIWFESEENNGSTFCFTLPLQGSPKKEGDVTMNT